MLYCSVYLQIIAWGEDGLKASLLYYIHQWKQGQSTLFACFYMELEKGGQGGPSEDPSLEADKRQP